MALTLVIGNKNYSSWSMRPWLALRASGIAFDEVFIPLYTGEAGKNRILAFTHSGKVPVLIDGDVVIWESLAILEYVAEKFPQAGLWPADAKARAHARAISHEMHAGFAAMRKHLPMNMWRPPMPRDLPPDVAASVARIQEMWRDCRARFGAGGPFLFGGFTIADAMYAPVVARFATYQIAMDEVCAAYMKTLMALPAWREWTEAALKETSVLPEDEPDWPKVLRV
jgi:glutathione S-transferase